VLCYIVPDSVDRPSAPFPSQADLLQSLTTNRSPFLNRQGSQQSHLQVFLLLQTRFSLPPYLFLLLILRPAHFSIQMGWPCVPLLPLPFPLVSSLPSLLFFPPPICLSAALFAVKVSFNSFPPLQSTLVFLYP